MAAQLSQRTVLILLKGRHAPRFGRSLRQRARSLEEIAASYSRAELLEERGIGEAVASSIEQWLAERGMTIRQEAVTEPILNSSASGKAAALE